MTRSLQVNTCGTDFGRWIRDFCRDSKTGLTVTNLDYVVQDYKRRELMLVEEKTRGGRLHYGQQQTFKLLDNIVRWACSHPQSKTKYRGFHVVRFAGTTPENSNWIEIDGKRVTRDQVVEFMNLEFDSKD